MITRIDATNYRCFEQLGISLRPFAILAGPNGSGKTTLLDIPLLFGDLLRSRNVAHAFIGRLLRRGARAMSLTELPFRSGSDSFALGIEAKLPDRIACALYNAQEAAPVTHIRYELRLQIEDSRQLVVADENLFLFPASEAYERARRPLQAENPEKDDFRFILSRSGRANGESKLVLYPDPQGAQAKTSTLDRTVLALPKLQYESESEFVAGRWLLNELLEGAVFFDPAWPQLRAPAPPGLQSGLMGSGENLPWLALSLQRADPERFQLWVGHVQTALPQITKISAHEREEDHHAYLRIRYEGGFSVGSSGLSEGTLRILALTLVAYLPDPPSLLVVEEPENSIYPQAIEAVMESLRSLYDSTVWVSTHSPVVLADAERAEIVIAQLGREGAAKLVHGEQHARLDQAVAIDLGSLFAMGALE